jgi:MFS family permease
MAAQPTRKELRLVITASSLGALFEWYDFYVYGTLAVLFGKLFFPEASAATGFLLALATFGVGFVVRPVGAVLFGMLGDRLGRKYTFIATITLMGLATAAIGCLPTYASIGVAAPILLVTMRALQGLALGGEYGGATIYVAEHVPAHRRAFYTSFIQATVPAALMLSVIVSLGTMSIIGETAWEAWGWRIPFLVSLVLLAISLWMRIKLAESPVFKAMKAAGEVSRHPLRESFDSWPKVKLIAAALVGVCAGQAVIGYTVMFQTLYYLQNVLHVEPLPARFIVIAGALSGVVFMILLGWLSDRVGRKKPLVIGYVLGIVLIFPYFHLMAANAGSPVTLAGLLILAFFVSTLSYATVAAWLVELFPARVRYTSLSIPYHFGIGYAGGLLPFISQYIVSRTGDPLSGHWYAVTVASIALVVVVLFVPETLGKERDTSHPLR